LDLENAPVVKKEVSERSKGIKRSHKLSRKIREL